MPGSQTFGHALGRLYNQQQQNASRNNAILNAQTQRPDAPPRPLLVVGATNRLGLEGVTGRRLPTSVGGGGGGGGGIRNTARDAAAARAQAAANEGEIDVWAADQQIAAAQQRSNNSFATAMSSRRAVGGGRHNSYNTGRNRFRPSATAGGLVAQNIAAAATARRRANQTNLAHNLALARINNLA